LAKNKIFKDVYIKLFMPIISKFFGLIFMVAGVYLFYLSGMGSEGFARIDVIGSIVLFLVGLVMFLKKAPRRH